MLQGGVPCQETAGFLFAHPCKNAASGACGTCGKAICVAHTHLAPETGTPTCIRCRGTQPGEGEEAGDDSYSYSEGVYSDYHEYDRYDSYTRSDRQVFDAPTPGAEAVPANFGGEAEVWESDIDDS